MPELTQAQLEQDLLFPIFAGLAVVAAYGGVNNALRLVLSLFESPVKPRRYLSVVLGTALAVGFLYLLFSERFTREMMIGVAVGALVMLVFATMANRLSGRRKRGGRTGATSA